MMGQQPRTDSLFYYFRLEDQIPDDHLLKRLDRFIDFGFVRERLRDTYSAMGRPSIDPEVLLRLLLVGYLYGITSERRLMEEVRMHLAYRWFSRLGFEREIPDHSTFSKNRHGRFRGALLEALRHREQEIFSYLAILVPALGGFAWLLNRLAEGNVSTMTFMAGTLGVLLILLLGAAYSLTLGYNYRYITFQLAKIEHRLKVTNTMLHGWPKSPKDFRARYSWHSIPWCTPSEMIKVFWLAFLAGMLWVTVAASYATLDFAHSPGLLVKFVGSACLLFGLLAPAWFGRKIMNLCDKEPEEWDQIVESTLRPTFQ